MPRLFADLHAHPALFSFNRMRNHPEFENDPERFHAWHMLPSNVPDMDKGARARAYTQSTPAMLADAKGRLIFASITPIEKGFFVGSTEHPETKFGTELIRLLSGATVVKAAGSLVRGSTDDAARELARILRNRGPARRFFQTVFLRYGAKRIDFMISDQYDYWREFELEHEFYACRDGQHVSATYEYPAADGGETLRRVDSAYHLVRDDAHLAEVIDDSEEVGFVMTIEGAHTFTIGPGEKTRPKAEIMGRIADLKAMDNAIFFITLAHHFDNGICGHARSIPDAGHWVMDQQTRLSEGFERREDLGLSVVRGLLGLDAQLKDLDEPRILIDCKHMAPKSRQEYYAEVITPYNAKRRTKNGRLKIPVIFSHGALSGVCTLDKIIADDAQESDEWLSKGYLAWGINLSDEDVCMVAESEGLLGLVFDQRVLGVHPKAKTKDDKWPDLLLHHIFGFVDIVLTSNAVSAKAKASVWDRLCIGSDYDGLIDPVSRYPTVLSYSAFADDLRARLEERKDTRGIAKIGVDELVEKIAWRNAYDFAKRHLATFA